ncbi:MAG: alpha/beta hydrolase, partial [Rickettsiales bacterium]|nr:alpha/beta hydrolase [Rickettsiales bacterium]
SKRRLRSLAFSGLFVGKLKNILTSLGAVSTDDKNRDRIILNDLVNGVDDWVIYPEGAMIKSKEISRKRFFINKTPEREGPVRTGAAVLAIKSQIYRDQIIRAKHKQDENSLNYFRKEYGLEYNDELQKLNTKIVPVTISYYPLRPGKNRIHDLAHRVFKRIPKQFAEELEIEGNLMLNAEISIRFNPPIDVADYVGVAYTAISQIPIIKRYTKADLVVKYYRNALTYHFMHDVYNNLEINFDHIFALSIALIGNKKIKIDRLKRIIYLSVSMIHSIGKYNLNSSLNVENLVDLFGDEQNKFFKSVMDLAKSQNVLEVSGSDIKIKKNLINTDSEFHMVRIENSLSVIANELSILRVVSDIIKRNVSLSDEFLRKKVFNYIYELDLNKYKSDYTKYYDRDFSKDFQIGKPFFMGDSKSKKGIVLCHGYKSSPIQFMEMAKFLVTLGFVVYAIRLDGHGTSPKNIKDSKWESWYNSLQRGYGALANICDSITIIGFSTGGLLALLKSSKVKVDSKLVQVISINSALKLKDIRTKLVPGINLWNDLLKKFNINSARLEYIDDHSENPETNYTRNYLKGVDELGKLMGICDRNLKNINVPTLIIQGDNDNIVSPISGEIIYNKISSKDKKLEMLRFDNHSIINNAGKERVFEVIENFLSCKSKIRR